jgi:hypothetical protein
MPPSKTKRKRSDTKQRLLRAAKTRSDYKYGMGGLPKERNAPRPVSLARVSILNDIESDVMPEVENEC